MSDVQPTAIFWYSSQCDGKAAFKKIGHAKAAAKRRTGRVVYRCRHCFHWHVGTPERKRKFTKRDKLIRLFIEPEWRTDD